MPLLELTRVQFVEPGIFPPGKNSVRATLLSNEESSNRLRERPAFKLLLDLDARVLYIVNINPTEKGIAPVPLERVLQWEEKGLTVETLIKRAGNK